MSARAGILVFLLAVVGLAAAFASGCGEEDVVGPSGRTVEVAGKPAPGVPTVTGTVPTTAPQDTTLDVQVSGTGFDSGSRVDMTLDGVVTPKVKTNSTRFVTKTTLVANITIAGDADPDLYDVIVTTTKGKRGIGIELFEITYKMTELGLLPGDDSSMAVGISQADEIVGGSGNSRPWRERIFFWANGIIEEVGTGFTRAGSNNRRVLGMDFPSVWEEVGGTWVETRLPLLPGGFAQQALDISPDGTLVAGSTGGAAVLWEETGGSWSVVPLPGGGTATAVNDLGMIAGADGGTAGVWIGTSGSWAFHSLGTYPAGKPAFAWGINAVGDVVGCSSEQAGGMGFQWALLWRKSPSGWDAPEYLGSLGTGGSCAVAINNARQVVGTSRLTNDTLSRTSAFVWTSLGGMVGLGSRFTDNDARDINDAGKIVGANRKAAGNNSGGDYVAVMWELK